MQQPRPSMASSSYYTQERLENISHIMPTYAAFVKPGDRVMMGIKDDPCFPAAYRSTRPLGTVTSIVGPMHSEVINVQLDEKFGGKMAHCDTCSVNPYLSFELTEPTFQNALKRSQENPQLGERVRSYHEQNDVVFRGMFSTASAAVPKDASLESRLARVEKDLASFQKSTDEKIENTRDVTFRAVRGVSEDIRKNLGERTYAGRMLHLLDGKDEPKKQIRFRGVGGADDASDSSDSDDGF